MERAVVRVFGQTLFAVALGYVGASGMAFLAMVVAGASLGFDAREAAFFLSLGAGVFLAASAMHDLPLRRSLALSWPHERRVVIGFAAVLVAVLAVEAVVAFSGLLGSLDEIRSLSQSERSLLGFVNAVILAPVVEEMLFRGLLFTVLRRYFAALPTLAIVTLAFGLLHIENGLLHVVSVLPAGAFLGFAREISGGIGLPILLHAAMNLAIVVAGSLL